MNEKLLKNNEDNTNVKNEGAAAVDTVSKIAEGEVQDYKTRYGKIYQVDVTLEPDDETTLNYSFIFKKPVQASFDRYMRSMNNSPMKAARVFINDNIIPEQKDKIDEIAKEYPAMIITINEKLLFALGLGKETNIKKL